MWCSSLFVCYSFLISSWTIEIRDYLLALLGYLEGRRGWGGWGPSGFCSIMAIMSTTTDDDDDDDGPRLLNRTY